MPERSFCGYPESVSLLMLAITSSVVLFVWGFDWPPFWGGIVGIWLAYFTYIEPIWPESWYAKGGGE